MKYLQDGATIQAERRPDAIAVVFHSERLTYGDLEDRSNRFARMIREMGCGRHDRVCILLPKGPLAVTLIHGILKAGCVYVPVDLTDPAQRVARIVRVCRPHAIVASTSVATLVEHSLALVESSDEMKLAWTDRGHPGLRGSFFIDDLDSLPSTPVERGSTPSDPAYIMFTSGSTGMPKGVTVTHANVLPFLRWAVDYFGISLADRISGHPPLHFDLSVLDLFGAMLAGAELHLLPPELSLLPKKLASYIRDHRLTQWFSVPSVMNYMAKFDVIRHVDFPHLKRVLWCGEVLPTPTLMYWMQRLPHASFTNLYGPTETTIASSYYTVPACPTDAGGSIPIGVACDGEKLLVLDSELRPVAAGEIGELYIGGVGVSRGYWNAPRRTAKVFLSSPDAGKSEERIYKTGDLASVDEQGRAWFHGRIDAQVKTRGHRVELGEIESSLNAMSDLKESAVVAVGTDGFEGTAICCAYSPIDGADLSPARLRQMLRRHLPGYMLPGRWARFDALPKNRNGKIDRQALRRRFQAG